ncbi:MAG: carbon starvation protein A [Planctomycetota bacterium]
MSTFLIAAASFFGFIIAYNTYGRWLAGRIFNLDETAVCPAAEVNDGVDYVPTRKSIVFGHHFTSIAGTGPIVGPAIAVFWGWLPALLWVVFGSIFIGAVHDFGSLVVSLRNRGQTVGEVAGRLISPRTRVLFLLILFFALTIVLAIFGLVIAVIFKMYPESVLPVWISLPIAVVIGLLVRRGAKNLLSMSLMALGIIYISIYIGAYHLPITLGTSNDVVAWTIILLAYCAVASVLPVWLLLQPRDYVNSHQLFLALGLLVTGLAVASLTGKADLVSSAPSVVDVQALPQGTPPIWPFLFITIACGAISGFHCLVSSGTSSKQISNECDAKTIGYGSMLLEGALAVVVILACCAGLGMGALEKVELDGGGTDYQLAMAPEVLTPESERTQDEMYPAWASVYSSQGSWSGFGLDKKISAFIMGSANFLSVIGIPLKLGIGLIAVLVACFAATTLDSATRLQRYVIQELGTTLRVPPLKNMYVATVVAVVLGGLIAMIPDAKGARGKGGLILWPLFGATNQLLAGLAFMVIVFYLWRRSKPVWFAVIPMIIMIIMPAWALGWQLFNGTNGWIYAFNEKPLLTSIGLATLVLQAWMVVEAIIMWPRARGVLEEAIPPLSGSADKLEASGGRSC